MSAKKSKILVVDDSELNRALLVDMLEDDFDIIEAENGEQAIAVLVEQETDISLMLLDIVMPAMDGFEVLAIMNKKGWIKTIPVIMISAETGSAYIDRAYDLGAVDYISRPFDERTVQHRVMSNYMLMLKQHEMANMLTTQIYEKEKDNRLMIEILSHIVEFRNGESGLHVLHVNAFTELILTRLMQMTDKYKLTDNDLHIICIASALHDIGKISIPSEILNKPGRLTKEEFEQMKKHTVEGANMLDAIPFRKNEALIKVGYQICRWHHERYDGSGYPDGLKGDDIPISAQAVALADVYDALTSERVYKAAIPHDDAIAMILDGECGAFNPLLMQCLKDIADTLKDELHSVSFGHATDHDIMHTVERTLKSDGPDVSVRTIRLLEHERMKNKFMSDISHEIQFEYIVEPEMIVLSEWGAETLGMPEKIINPSESDFANKVLSRDDYDYIINKMRQTTPERSVLSEKISLNLNGNKKWCKLIAKVMWGDAEAPEFEGAIGKIIDVDEETEELRHLELLANHDACTGLLNHNAAKRQISKLLEGAGAHKYALIFFDLDNLKVANDNYGHLFGDELLKTIADRIRKNTRSLDISARMGGDEFIIFMEYKDTIEPQVDRIFKRLTEPYKDFDVRLSMGVARAESEGIDYDALFEMADQAAYSVKRGGKNAYRFYDESVKSMFAADKKD